LLTDTHDDQAPTQRHDFADALAAFGLRAVEPDAVPGEEPEPVREVWLWPENEPVWQLWQCVQTQWHVGMGGATGLRYEGVRVVLEFSGMPRREWAWAFACIQGMERAALEVFASQQD
jgi:Phage related hypothetical protein (DUF1799)